MLFPQLTSCVCPWGWGSWVPGQPGLTWSCPGCRGPGVTERELLSPVTQCANVVPPAMSLGHTDLWALWDECTWAQPHPAQTTPPRCPCQVHLSPTSSSLAPTLPVLCEDIPETREVEEGDEPSRGSPPALTPPALELTRASGPDKTAVLSALSSRQPPVGFCCVFIGIRIQSGRLILAVAFVLQSPGALLFWVICP